MMKKIRYQYQFSNKNNVPVSAAMILARYADKVVVNGKIIKSRFSD